MRLDNEMIQFPDILVKINLPKKKIGSSIKILDGLIIIWGKLVKYESIILIIGELI